MTTVFKVYLEFI